MARALGQQAVVVSLLCIQAGRDRDRFVSRIRVFVTRVLGAWGRERILFDLGDVAGSYLQRRRALSANFVRRFQVQCFDHGDTYYSNHLIQHCGGLRCGDIDKGRRVQRQVKQTVEGSSVTKARRRRMSQGRNLPLGIFGWAPGAELDACLPRSWGPTLVCVLPPGTFQQLN